MNKPIPDQKQRDLIAHELETSFFVEAGAGSGKTHSLVDRMVGIIRRGYAGIENVIAVTFTRKAAAELRERFQIRLEELLKSHDTTDAEKKYINQALLRFESASISTMHTFCAKILKERPVEAGIDPDFEEIEETEDFMFAEQVWCQYIENQGLEGNQAIGWLQDHGIDYKSLKDIYVKLVCYPDIRVFTQSVPRPDFQLAKKRIKEFLVLLGKDIPKVMPNGGWDDLQSIVRSGLKLIDLGYLEEERLFVNLLTLLTKKIKVTQKKWRDTNLAKTCEAEAQQFQSETVVPALRQWREYLHKPLVDFALDGVKYYEEWRKERSVLNFQDLLMKSATLLRNNAEVRAYYKKNIKFLLVDEFQDTDPIQAEIVMLLTGEDNSIDDWHKVRPKPGTLFLVGDPKQRKSARRRADIDIYNKVKSIFKDGAGKVIELTSNFRSLEHITGLTNTVFKNIFPEKDSQYQAKFTPLVNIRGLSAKHSHGIYKILLPEVERNRREPLVREEARSISSWIYNAINGNLKLERTEKEVRAGETEDAKPGDFMIITKKKDMLSWYARALEELGIPYEMSGGDSFANSAELNEIYKVLKAVADPKDPVVLVAALRGLFFGISDNDLYQFVKQGGRIYVYSKVENGPANIKNAFERIKKYCDIVARNSPVTALEIIIEHLGIIPLAISGKMGSSRAGNILKALELLRELRSDMTGTFPEIVEYLKELLVTEGIEEMGLFPGTGKSVRIMNLHKAKGLEAPVIILADPLGVAKDHEPQLHVKRTSESSVGYFLVTKSKGEYSYEVVAEPKEWERYGGDETLYDKEEANRLDYVAVTRAKNILVISVYEEGEKKKAWESLYPYLQDKPELKIDSFPTPKPREIFTISKKRLTKEQTNITDTISLMNEPTYQVATVTELIDKKDIFKGDAAQGASWGRIIHKALEACGRGKRDKLEILAKNWLIDEGRPSDDLHKIISLVDGIIKSEMWQRVLRAEEKYFEIPFSSPSDNGIVYGIIDLIFKEPDGWVIVDYKTDNFETNVAKKEAYERQLEMYAGYWGKITQGKVKEKKLCRVAGVFEPPAS